ncbi:MAG: rhamnan synthesis F family protein [Pseudomonadota bacterium]
MNKFLAGLFLRQPSKKGGFYHALLSDLALDWSVYCARHGVASADEAIDHYLENWLDCSVDFVDYFDSDYYLASNTDVRLEKVNPLVHFVLYGEKEGRLGTPSAYNQLKNCAALDWSVYLRQLNLPLHVDPVQHYLLNWKDASVSFAGFFDTKTYLEHNSDLVAAGVCPLLHFVRHGQQEGRVAWINEPTAPQSSLPERSDDYHALRSCAYLDWSSYVTEFMLGGGDDPIAHYLEHWKSIRPVFQGFFDTDLYLNLYPDLLVHEVNPLLHFIRHGMNEGRRGWLMLEEFSVPGGIEFSPEKKTIIVSTHEASATGAPVVALELARRLGGGYNVITLSGRKGKLHDSFVQAGVLHLDFDGLIGLVEATYVLEKLLQRYDIHAVLLNSVESYNLATGVGAVAPLGLPCVGLLHEYAEYTRPVGKMGVALFFSDVIIYPAESLKQSGLRDLKENLGAKHIPNHVWVQPQGSMQFGSKAQDHGASEHILRRRLGIPESAILIAGAGHVQPRKGVDWFAETAYYITRRMHEEAHPLAGDVHFVWLGDGYDPNDLAVSVWLEAYIRRAGLKQRMHFAGHVSSVSEALSDADIYLLTSRLDPFPNVAIDAMVADCGIGCFAEASGVADFLQTHASRSVIAPYGDCAGLAGQVVERLDWLVERDGVNRKLAEEELCFEHYLSVIEQALDEAVRRQSALAAAMQGLEESGSRFDEDFYGLTFGKLESMRHFLTLLQKGLVIHKPYPGSGIQAFLDHAPYDGREDFTVYTQRALAASSENAGGLLVAIDIDGAETEPYQGAIAIQFHVYYNDLIAEYADYFACLREYPVDLYVSHVHPLEEAELESLRSAVSGEVFTLRVGNEGRDVYPFHRLYVESIAGRYDVVGHFHTKKSKDSGERLGDRWRRYLLSNLIGSKPAASQILAQFNAPEVGLVYAEDRHCVDEADNGEYIQELLEQMGLKAQPPYYHFPLGTMFWARTEALAALKALDLDVFRLPEPIPYDGSVLHAFERIVPQLIVSAGYKPRRVYTDKTFW